MTVTCEHCKKEIESKNELIVMPQWGFIPRPLHKQCWGDLALSNKGVGSVSYQTGALRGRQMKIPINSMFFSVIAVIALLIGFFILASDLSGATITSNGTERAVNPTEGILFQVIIFFVFMIPLIIRLWSYTAIESKF